MISNNNNENYDDIINLPRHISKNHPQMSVADRAAQFSPFAALIGHDDTIEETARLTDKRIELDEDRKSKINEKLQFIVESMNVPNRNIGIKNISYIRTNGNNYIGTNMEVAITYFVPDNRKLGGEYVTKKGIVTKFKKDENILVLTDIEQIDFVDIDIKEIVDIEFI